MKLEPPTIIDCHGHRIEKKSSKNIPGKAKVAPKGCVAVYVGEEEKRFVIPIDHLYHPSFTELLEEAEEVYGFDQKGPLRIPCNVHRFQRELGVIQSGKQNA